ncbi:hypothetical protein NDK47_09240 [Brevibacillus ruminantium]|uniref:Transcriptional regulator n=1 Tax=Brevibacillus ruminantium TaxID=2950604 RepID=A0ABY4WJV6_9BACL|nr:hypothetical protein [Brevibacillus ruminantium]USG67438.1 hypothetical protein NDK47_09240 [Brevibacillus ruminantium]
MYRIGVVGPLPSVERIMAVANEFEHEIEFVPIVYEDAKEVSQIVMERSPDFNGWFFSGPIPFTIAKNVLSPDANMVYCPPTGSNLYRCFIQLSIDHDVAVKRVSIDMINSEGMFLHEQLAELGIPDIDQHVLTYDEHYDAQKIADFHVQLWRAGKTQGAFTTLATVERKLRSEGIPVYRIFMTKMEIRQAMKMVIEKARSSYFKDTQIGVEIIELEQFDTIAEKSTARYHLQNLELKVRQVLLHLCERLDGSLMANGNGRYQIFSSRGAIEREIDMLRTTVQQLSLDADVPVAVGIGFGETAFSAESNARKAIQHAKERNGYGIVIVQDDGVIVETVGENEQIAYAYRSSDKDLLEKLNKANVSVKTYHKIEALVQRMGWTSFTTSDIASYLSMTVRNAQRILGSLCEHGLAEYRGEELQATRGRPKKMYQLKK